MGMEGDDNNTHSLGKWRMGVDVPLHSLEAAHSCSVWTEGANNDAHSFAEWRTRVDMPPPLSGNDTTNTSMTTQMMMTT